MDALHCSAWVQRNRSAEKFSFGLVRYEPDVGMLLNILRILFVSGQLHLGLIFLRSSFVKSHLRLEDTHVSS